MDELLTKVKANLILEHTADDALAFRVTSPPLFHTRRVISTSRREPIGTRPCRRPRSRPIIMLASHFYESRDGGTGGFFSNTIGSAQQVWNTVNLLLRLDRNWQV